MKVELKNVRLRYSNGLYVASKFTGVGADPNAKEKYEGKFIIEKGDANYDAVVGAIQKEAIREWGAAADETLRAVKSLGMIWCLIDGDTKKDDKHTIGKFIVTAKNTLRPLLCDKVVDPATGKARVIQSSTDPKAPYGGCYVNAIVDVRAGSKPQKQVYAYLLGVQYWGDGDRLGAAQATADDFEAIPGTEAAGTPASAAGGADALF